MRTKEIRRHNALKFKKRCQSLIRNFYGLISDNLSQDARFVGKLSRTRKPCSCFMCGNPRKYFGQKPLGERRWEQVETI